MTLSFTAPEKNKEHDYKRTDDATGVEGPAAGQTVVAGSGAGRVGHLPCLRNAVASPASTVTRKQQMARARKRRALMAVASSIAWASKHSGIFQGESDVDVVVVERGKTREDTTRASDRHRG